MIDLMNSKTKFSLLSDFGVRADLHNSLSGIIYSSDIRAQIFSRISPFFIHRLPRRQTNHRYNSQPFGFSVSNFNSDALLFRNFDWVKLWRCNALVDFSPFDTSNSIFAQSKINHQVRYQFLIKHYLSFEQSRNIRID